MCRDYEEKMVHWDFIKIVSLSIIHLRPTTIEFEKKIIVSIRRDIKEEKSVGGGGRWRKPDEFVELEEEKRSRIVIFSPAFTQSSRDGEGLVEPVKIEATDPERPGSPGAFHRDPDPLGISSTTCLVRYTSPPSQWKIVRRVHKH